MRAVVPLGRFGVLLAVRMSISMLTVCFDFHQFRQVPTAEEMNSTGSSKTTLCYDNPHGIVDSTLKLGKDDTCIEFVYRYFYEATQCNGLMYIGVCSALSVIYSCGGRVRRIDGENVAGKAGSTHEGCGQCKEAGQEGSEEDAWEEEH